MYVSIVVSMDILNFNNVGYQMNNDRRPASRPTNRPERQARPSNPNGQTSQNNSGNQSNKKPTKQKKQKSTLGMIIRVLIIVLVVGCFAIGGALIGAYFGIIAQTEDINPLSVTPTIFSSKIIIDSTDEVYTTLEGTENREYVMIDTLPDYVGNAFVAIEDERFYEHNGVDIRGTIRSGVSTLTHHGVQGGSTITQQLIKNIRGLQRNTIKTKIQEQYLAIQYEKDMQEIYGSKEAAKEKILEIYLNTINLGGDYNGVQTASRGYFNKDAKDLTIAESAVIASITQYPSYYNPLLYPENNRKRQLVVLQYMNEQGFITDAEYTEAVNEDVYSKIADYNVSIGNNSKDSYYTDEVKIAVTKDLAEKYNISQQEAYNMLFNAGLEIRIPIDPTIQNIVDQEYLDDSNFPSAGYKIQVIYLLDIMSAEEGKAKHYEKRTYVKSMDEVPAFVESVKAECVKPGDEIIAEATYPVVQPQSSFVVIDNTTGYVVAIEGGRGEKLTNLGLNRATSSERQPGSTFKIVSTYAPGIDTGVLTLGSVIDDVPFSSGDHEFKNWYTNPFPYRGLSTVREGIRDSMNIVAVKAMQQVGVETAFNYLENFGFTTLVEDDKNLSTALGGVTYGVTNLELTAAYATIANGGQYREPVFYTQVYDHDGNLILDNTQNESRQVIKPTTAWLLTDAMEDVVSSGTGTPARFTNIDMPVAGKTGTTSESKDLWFEGYTPYYTAGVWLGYDDPQTISDGVYHKTLWKNIMEEIHIQKGLSRKEFVKPDGIVTAEICSESGQLATDLCKQDPRGSTVYTEYFASGTVPTTSCDVHVSVDIDTSTGQLATEYCPDDVVSSVVRIVRPSGEVAGSNVADAQYQLDNLEPCTTHTSSSSSGSSYTVSDLVALGGLDYLTEGVDYYIDPETGEVVLSEGVDIDKVINQILTDNSGGTDIDTDTEVEVEPPTIDVGGDSEGTTDGGSSNTNTGGGSESTETVVEPPPVEIPEFTE